MKADDIISIARSVLGVEFKHQGRTIYGLDCVGLLLYVATKLGISYTDEEGYSRYPSNGRLEEVFDEHAHLVERVPITAIQKGDILMMKFNKEPQHIAIYTGENIIHSYLQAGKVSEHRLDDLWRSRIVRVYRFIGVIL